MKRKFSFAHLGAIVGGKKPRAAETPIEEEEAEDMPEEDTDGEDTPEEEAEETQDDEKKDEPAASLSAKEKKAQAAGRKAGAEAERKRCASIFQAKEASGREALAAELAFNTGMTAEAAIAVLKSSPKASSLASRMKAHDPKIGAAAAAPADERVAAAASAYRARRGLK